MRIPFLIPGDLRAPILCVARWKGIVLAATMPEAPIHEYGDLPLWKQNINDGEAAAKRPRGHKIAVPERV